MRVGSSRGIKPRDRAERLKETLKETPEESANESTKENAGSARAAKLTNRSKPIGGTGQSL